MDARGHGASDKPHDPVAYELSLRVSDVVAVLDDLHLTRAHYWGHSMGGWIGFGMAKYAPERIYSLIICAGHPYEIPMPAASSRMEGATPDAIVEAWLTRLNVDSASVPPAAREEMLANDFQALAAARQGRPSLEAILPDMAMPCLLYAGDADPSYPKTRECAQHIPNATFISLPGLDHATAFRGGALQPHGGRHP